MPEAKQLEKQARRRQLPLPVPIKKETVSPTAAFFTRVFRENWQKFFKAHQKEYDDFIATEGLKDRAEVRMQWSCAMMSYFLCRYGGGLGVNFKLTKERGDVLPTRPVPAEVRDRKQIYGTKFSVLLNDILSGSEYKDKKSKAGYITFGDCDEIALLMAQFARALAGKDSKLAALSPQIYRIEQEHASVAMKISGKWFLFDPTFGDVNYPMPIEMRLNVLLAAAVHKGRKWLGAPVSRIRASIEAGIKGGELLPVYNDRYEKLVVPSLNRQLGLLKLPKIARGQKEFIEREVKRACEPHVFGQSEIAKEASRRKWGYSKSFIYDTIEKDFLPEARKRNLHAKAAEILSDFLAASTEGNYARNRNRIKQAVSWLGTEEQKVRFLQGVIRQKETKGTRFTVEEIAMLAASEAEPDEA